MSENRQAKHKNAGKKYEARLNRREVAVQLRKSAREEQMSKRRNLVEDLNTSPLKTNSPDRNDDERLLPKTYNEIRSFFESGIPSQLRRATKACRKKLSASGTPPIDEIIDAGFVDPLIKCLYSNDTSTQKEAAWALTNITCGDERQTAAVVNKGGISGLTHCFNNDEDPETVEQAIWAIGNICGDGPRMRDLVLEHGIVNKIMPHIKSEQTNEFLANLTWMLSNLCRNKPAPEFKQVEPLLLPLNALLGWKESRCNIDSAWALSYFSDGGDEYVEAMTKVDGLIKQLMTLAASSKPKMMVPAIRALGNGLTGDDINTEAMMSAGYLDMASYMLTSEERKPDSVIKDVIWGLSNIAAGTSSQQHRLAASTYILAEVGHQIKGADFKIRKECCYLFGNLVTGAKKLCKDDFHNLLMCKSLQGVASILECSDTALIEVALRFYKSMLELADQYTINILDIVEECGALDSFEKLQMHESDEIYSLAVFIVETWFGCDEIADDGEELAFKEPLREANMKFSF